MSLEPRSGEIKRLNANENKSQQEQRILRLSVIITFLIAMGGVVVGIVANSSSIIFDGIYSGIDCFFSLAALMVVRLIQYDTLRHEPKYERLSERFQFGFWHLEPMVLAINGISLSIAVFYGLFEAVNSIFHGGQLPLFGNAIVYVLLAIIVCFGLAYYEARCNRRIGSAFIAIDIKGWVISGCLSLAILIAFVFALLIKDTAFGWLIPYIDPAILAIICVIMAPLPLRVVKKAMKEIFLVTPRDLDNRVADVVEEVIARYGFVDAQTYVSRVGRATTIEVHLVLPHGYPIQTVEWLDKVRGEIGDAIGGAGPNRWFTVSFTAKPEWT